MLSNNYIFKTTTKTFMFYAQINILAEIKMAADDAIEFLGRRDKNKHQHAEM